ncbi:hypothetical protein M9Y10_022289 [Tritrichomonas musculus]|uniref:Uncharacterized protein n=1 Tax=Tritrichomonas musculus TaxID=1915356 RepID=A0ABR2KRX3_9EUKA
MLSRRSLITCEVCVKPATTHSQHPVPKKLLSFEVPVMFHSQDTQKTQENSQGISLLLELKKLLLILYAFFMPYSVLSIPNNYLRAHYTLYYIPAYL